MKSEEQRESAESHCVSHAGVMLEVVHQVATTPSLRVVSGSPYRDDAVAL